MTPILREREPLQMAIGVGVSPIFGGAPPSIVGGGGGGGGAVNWVDESAVVWVDEGANNWTES